MFCTIFFSPREWSSESVYRMRTRRRCSPISLDVVFFLCSFMK
ncbi:hypothetical protein SSCG_06087 [Streptomyces clavuligerus]|nr:hypothetical protein SSCG_06087 [Streptomyces clavuligerus]